MTKTGQTKLNDVIQQELIPLALEQGIDPPKAQKFYMNYNKMINKFLSIEPNNRDNLPLRTLYELDKMLGMAADKVHFLVVDKVDYHQIYRETKDFILDYSSHWLMIR